MKNSRITGNDISMLQYFWTDKEDLERCMLWRDMVPALREQFPEILKAWEDYKTARRMLTAVLDGVSAPWEDE